MTLIVLIGLAAALCAGYLYLRCKGYCYLGRTMGGWTAVHNDMHVMGECIRVLEVDGAYQSATYLDERWAQPVFPYHLLFDHLFDAWPRHDGPRTVAVLGGGGYAIPKHLVADAPQIEQVDVVEIDPAIEDIARRYFFLDRIEQEYGALSSGRMRLHTADAADWLASCDGRFDVILNDCFLGLNPEDSFMTTEGMQLVYQHLNPNGLYLSNVVSALDGSEADTLYALIGALRAYFARVWVYPCSPDQPQSKDNNIVIASNARIDFEGAWEWPSE